MAGKCGCLPPSRPDLGGLERGCGHRPQPWHMLTHLSQQWLFIGIFSEITSTWGRSVGPGVQELLPGAGILGGYSAPPDATVSIPGTGFTSGQVSQRLLVPIIVFR